MMKLIVLAVAVTAVSAGTVLTGLPLAHGAYPYTGLTGALPYTGLTGAYPYTGLTGALPYTGLTGALPIATSHIGSPITYAAAPATYVAGPATALVNPTPYQIHTGVRAEVAVEPVEQHGYVVKY